MLLRAQTNTQNKPLRHGYWGSVGRQFLKNKSSLVGLVVLTLLVLTAIFAPQIAPYDPIAASSAALQAPSMQHIMGTDVYGRDLLSRIMFGTRFSLPIGFLSVGIGLAAGMVIGMIGGFFGGRLDAVIVMLIDAMLAFPGILLALAIIAVLGPGLTNVMIAVGISSIPTFARLARSSLLSVREREYVESARAIGVSNVRILRVHITPNIIAPLVVLATLRIPTAILSAAGLSFLGLGAQPPIPEWGLLVSEGRKFIRTGWWVSLFPGFAIMLAVMSFNLLGDGLRDANDPRLRG